MPGRAPIPEQVLLDAGYRRPEQIRRRVVLRETLAAFATAEDLARHHAAAARNLARWHAARELPEPRGELRVVRGDWGVVTAALTREYGTCFAVLNMANAFKPGGAYIEGTAAQEENMFRRTDCHFCVSEDSIDAQLERYQPAMTRLLSAADGRVYLDTERARVCVRGPEQRAREDLGYAWLAADEVFPFFELRAAAQDIRAHRRFDEANARARIVAQLDTLREAGQRYAVLSAFGCGAFHNPPQLVAQYYKDALEAYREDFALIAFAIFDPGYGPDNYTPFAEAFS